MCCCCESEGAIIRRRLLSSADLPEPLRDSIREIPNIDRQVNEFLKKPIASSTVMRDQTRAIKEISTIFNRTIIEAEIATAGMHPEYGSMASVCVYEQERARIQNTLQFLSKSYDSFMEQRRYLGDTPSTLRRINYIASSILHRTYTLDKRPFQSGGHGTITKCTAGRVQLVAKRLKPSREGEAVDPSGKVARLIKACLKVDPNERPLVEKLF